MAKCSKRKEQTGDEDQEKNGIESSHQKILIKLPHLAIVLFLFVAIPLLYLTDNNEKLVNIDKHVSLNQAQKAANNSSSSVPKCNLFEGRWIYDDVNYPYYKEEECSFMEYDGKFLCGSNGRPDTKYHNWRWQPHHCDLPRFNGTAFLEKLRGKKLLFVGDSVNRNTWRSMLCMLESFLPSYSEKKLILKGSYYFFHSKEYNATIGFYWAPFLVESNNDDIGRHIEFEHILRIKSISKHGRHWLDADILIFDSYGWWWHPYAIFLWGSFGSSDAIYTKVQMKYRRYEMALSTWSDWLELQLNRTKTKVFFMSASPFHFSEGNLHAPGNCYEESEPYLKDGLRKNTTDPKMTEVLKSTLQKLDERGIKVEFINITYLSDFRKDAHVGIYHKKINESTRPTEEEIYEGTFFLDCLHWCVPGLPDIWNEILYSYIMKLKL